MNACAFARGQIRTVDRQLSAELAEIGGGCVNRPCRYLDYTRFLFCIRQLGNDPPVSGDNAAAPYETEAPFRADAVHINKR